MSAQEFPSVNDVACSWADIAVSFTVDGGQLLETSDISAVKFSDKLDIGEQKGTSGGRVMKRTQGSVSYEASITLYFSGQRKLIKALKDKAPQRGNQRRVSLVSFDIMVQHTPLGDDEIYAHKLKGCRLMGRSWDLKEGNDADVVEVSISPIEVVQIIDDEEIVLV